MKIDFLLVRPGPPHAGYLADRAGPLAAGLKKAGYQPAILTLHDDPHPPEGVPVLRLDYPDRVAAGVRWGPEAAHACGVTNFRHLAFCEDRYIQFEIRPRPYSRLIAEVPAAFAEVERLFEEHDIRRVMHPNMGGEIIRQVVSRVARRRGVPVVYESGTRYFPGKVLLVLDDQATLLSRARRRFDDLPEAKRRQLQAFLEAKRTQKPFVTYGNPKRQFLPLLREFVAKKKFADPRRLLKGFRTARKFAEFRIGQLYWKPADLRAPFVFYPIHFVIESNIILRNPSCFRQEFLIDYISRVLPQDMQLYVKQHPAYTAEGLLSLRAMRALARLGNVRFIPAQTNSFDLVRAARAVVTIHSTAGFEAVLMGRPAVVVGYPPYRGWGVTTDVSNLNDLPAALDTALASAIDEGQVLDFLASFESVHRDGDWYEEPLDPEGMTAAVVRAFQEMTGGEPDA